MYERDGLPKSKLVFNGTRSANIEGLVYLPSRDVIFNSPHVMTSTNQMLVFRTLIMNRADWTMGPADLNLRSAKDSETKSASSQ